MARVPAGYYLPPDADFVAPSPKKRAKRVDREAPIHVAIIRYLRLALPGALIFHAPNGAHMAGTPEQKAIKIAKLKAMGMLVGFPDIGISWRSQPLWTMEVKPPGEHPTQAQTDVGRMIEANGGRWAVVRSVTDAEDCIREWRGDMP